MESAPVLVRHAGGVAALRQLPPGFRFRPTDEELVVQYLRRKALGVPLPAAVIPVVRDLYSLDPWDIPAAADASEGEKYFFAVRPAGVGGGCSGKLGGARAATASGRWKPAGKEKPVVLPRPCGGGSLLVGVKRAMTFAPRRKKKASSAALAAGWVMHEYRLAAPLHKNFTARTVFSWQSRGCSLAQAEGEWVVCRVFQRSSNSNRPRRRATPAGGHAAAASPSSSSTASCVTDGSDQEEVSS
ncbi:NAC domain-containing protein 18-like isoform X3 [Panicum virgatum]|uniref:NAC domain-containing protein 18-like isoform X3 n=1 Tax=Panicum virgatum TaxID=38727 RepID=UPI0019D68143|nr:NAC domain-containing protein 18-like isoform X3 [Panicum virgatum]